MNRQILKKKGKKKKILVTHQGYLGDWYHSNSEDRLYGSHTNTRDYQKKKGNPPFFFSMPLGYIHPPVTEKLESGDFTAVVTQPRLLHYSNTLSKKEGEKKRILIFLCAKSRRALVSRWLGFVFCKTTTFVTHVFLSSTSIFKTDVCA